MTVKEAAIIAKDYIASLFADERITELGLEEVEFEDKTNCWLITVGFARPWEKPATDTPTKGLSNFYETLRATTSRRSYKVVTIKSDDGSVLSVKSR